jgi:hypothetical protein
MPSISNLQDKKEGQQILLGRYSKVLGRVLKDKQKDISFFLPTFRRNMKGLLVLVVAVLVSVANAR